MSDFDCLAHTDPCTIRTIDAKLLFKQIRIDSLVMVWVRCHFKALMTSTFDTMFFFDTAHHVLANLMSLFAQMSMQTLITISLFGFTVSSFYKQFTVITMYLLSTDITLCPVIVAWWFDIKDFTHAGNAKFIFVMVNKGVPYWPFFAKYAVAPLEPSSRLASGRSSASLHPSSFNISRSSCAVFSSRFKRLISSRAETSSGSYCLVPLSLPWLAFRCQLASVCIGSPNCLAVALTLPPLFSIALTASALNSSLYLLTLNRPGIVRDLIFWENTTMKRQTYTPATWSAIQAIAPKIGCTPETLRSWHKKHIANYPCIGTSSKPRATY